MSQSHKHPHDHHGHHRSHVQAHGRKYVALLAVLLMLAAMFAYTMSDDEAIVPNPGGKDTIQQTMPAAP